MTVPAASASATLSGSFTTAAPAGVPPLQNLASGAAPLAYVTVSSSATVTFQVAPSLTLSSPGVLPANALAYVAQFDPTAPDQGWAVLEGPAAANGTVLTFAGAPPRLTLVANATYVFALFTVSAALPTPIPSPQGSPALTPAAVKITALASPAPVQAGEQGYTGRYTFDASQCAGIATVTRVQPASFSVGGLAPGECAAVFTDAFGQTVALPISVTTSTITVK